MLRSRLCLALLALGASVAPSLGALSSKAGLADSLASQGSLAPMIERAMPAIVSVRVKGFVAVEQSPLYNHPVAGRLPGVPYGPVPQRPFHSTGSGVIVDPVRGLILTNYHVVQEARDIKVLLQSGRELSGRLIGRDAATDVAAVRVDSTDLAGIALGDSSKVRVGDLVVALGSPFGLEATATLGMVSSLRRAAVGYRDLESYIQHDAAVNSGSSGGALINMRGELIGINTAILSPSGGNVGLGFAIPARMAMQVMEQLVKYGRVRRGWAGASAIDLTAQKAQSLGIDVYKGALITAVRTGSPAELGHVQPDDLVVAVKLPDGRTMPVASAADLRTAEGITEIGASITLRVLRGGRQLALPVDIADLPRERERIEAPLDIPRVAGLVIGSLEADSPHFGEVSGVEVLEVPAGTLAQMAGLLPGDLVTQVDQARIRRPEDFLRAVKEQTAKLEMRVLRNGVPVVVRFLL